jgi:hypothetical protein
MPDLETQIVNRLQEKGGQTPDQLASHLDGVVAVVVQELKKLQGMGHVKVSDGDTGGI